VKVESGCLTVPHCELFPVYFYGHLSTSTSVPVQFKRAEERRRKKKKKKGGGVKKVNKNSERVN
jgi:hypothetical protein